MFFVWHREYGTLSPLTCRSAFSRLVADRRHAQLGLLLMGVLAQVHTVLRQVITNDGPTKGRDSSETENAKDDNIPPTRTLKTADDFGEVVARDDTDDEEGEVGQGRGKDKAKRVSPGGPAAPVAHSTKKRPRPKDDDEHSVDKAVVGIESTVKGSSAKVSPEKKTKTKTREIGHTKDEDGKEKRDKREKKDKDKPRKTKKRKKNGDEFDDLFDGLL